VIDIEKCNQRSPSTLMA